MSKQIISIRMDDDTLEFIDELRRRNNPGGVYASRSETVRRIISDWAFRMMQPIEAKLAELVVDEEKLTEVLENRGYEIEKKENENEEVEEE